MYNPNCEDVDINAAVLPNKFYIICSVPRTGSTLLSWTLWKTQLAGAPHEYFNNTHIPEFQKRWNFNGIHEYIDRLKQTRTSSNGVFGLKLHYSQYEKQLIRQYQIDIDKLFPEPYYIFLTRKNRLAQAVSWVRARQTNRWSSVCVEQNKPTYNAQQIEHALREIEDEERGWLQFFKNRGVVPYQIFYEDFVESYEDTVKNILNFLEIGIPADFAVPKQHISKIADNTNNEWIVKYCAEKPDLKSVKVSVAMATYNHKPFISQAIESVLNQKTDFEYELIIGDDYSVDGTRDKVISYAANYPNKIRALLHDKNLGGNGQGNAVQILSACRGKYIALCDGDDYWTDPYKLQKQVDFLERSCKYTFCMHNSMVQYESKRKKAHIAKTKIWDTISVQELITNFNDFTRDFLVCPAHTSSLVFRNNIIKRLPNWFLLAISGDLPLEIMLAEYGKGKFINEVMSVYRIHSTGISSSDVHKKNSLYRGRLHMYESLLQTINKQHSKSLIELINSYYKQKITVEKEFLGQVLADDSLPASLFEQLVEEKLIEIFNQLKEQIKRYLYNMKVGSEVGVYKYAETTTTPNIYNSTYACMIMSLLDDIQYLSFEDKQQWISYFDSFQNPVDGLFYDNAIKNDIFNDTDWWGARHLAVQIMQCYVILGGKPKLKFKFLEEFYDLEFFERYLEKIDFEAFLKSDFDNKLFNIGVLLQYNRDFFGDKGAREAVAFLQTWLMKKINKDTGLWSERIPTTPQEISRSVQVYYHLYLLFEYDNLDLPRIDKIIDWVLQTQNSAGGFGVSLSSSACEDIDSMDILIRFSKQTEYRNKDILLSLIKGFAWLLTNFHNTGGAHFRKRQAFYYGHEQMSTPANVPSLFATWFRLLNFGYLMKYFSGVFSYQSLESQFNIINAPGYTFLRKNFGNLDLCLNKDVPLEFYSVFTHMTKDELTTLYHLAISKQKSIVVEIGSYLGASSNFLAFACCQSNSHLFCVDTWKNDAMTEGTRDTYQEFKQNTRMLSAYITPLRGRSEKIAKTFNRKIDFIFFDGDHSYEGIKSDWDNWKNKLNDDAILVFHDWSWAEGIKKIIQEDVAQICDEIDHLPNMWWGIFKSDKNPQWDNEQNHHEQINASQMATKWNTAETRGQNQSALTEISVVVPTYNRATALDLTLKSILAQRLSDNLFEIIVVDNNSSDNTKQVIHELNKNSEGRIHYFFEPHPGLVSGRHRGAAEAKSDILVFCDDDIEADPSWLESILQAFQHPEVHLVGGPSLPKFESPPPDWMVPYFDYKNDRLICGPLSLINLGDRVQEIEAKNVWGLNFAIRKQTLFRIGGFHPDSFPQGLIAFRGDGETGLAYKLEQRGYRAVYHPGAKVYHHIPNNRLTVEYFQKRFFNQGISDSYTAIRKNGSTEGVSPLEFNPANPAIPKYKSFTQYYHEIHKAYIEGYNFHLNAVCQSSQLSAWVLKENYFDYELPELKNYHQPIRIETRTAKDKQPKNLPTKTKTLVSLVDTGMRHLNENQYEQALISFQQTIESDPTNAAAWAGIGQIAHQLGDERTAEAAFRRVYRLDPHQPALLEWIFPSALRQSFDAAVSPHLQQDSGDYLFAPKEYHRPHKRLLDHYQVFAREVPLTATGANFLEIGTGAGGVSYIAKKLGCDVIATDIGITDHQFDPQAKAGHVARRLLGIEPVEFAVSPENSVAQVINFKNGQKADYIFMRGVQFNRRHVGTICYADPARSDQGWLESSQWYTAEQWLPVLVDVFDNLNVGGRFINLGIFKLDQPLAQEIAGKLREMLQDRAELKITIHPHHQWGTITDMWLTKRRP